MKVDGIMRYAKANLVGYKHLLSTAVLEIMKGGKKTYTIIGLDFNGRAEKALARNQLKAYVLKRKAKRYWTIFEGWMATFNKGDKMYRQPKRDLNRRECIVINQYERGEEDIGYIQFFKRDDNDNPIFEETMNLENCESFWSAYSNETSLMDDELKFRKDINRAFMDKIVSDTGKKYIKEFKEAKTEQDKAKVYVKTAKDVMLKIKEQRKTILEDTDKEVL